MSYNYNSSVPYAYGGANFSPYSYQTVAPPNPTGVTRDEFNALSEKIDKLINDLGGTK